MGTITKIHNNNPQTTEEWWNHIAEPWWNKEVPGIIETGKRLIDSRKDKEYGEWEKIFKGKDRFSVQTALKLMAIAEHPVLSNPAHVRALPRSWGTLYELSQIPEPLLLRMIQDGQVHPELMRVEAKDLKGLEDKKEEFRQIIIAHAFQARELSLADCGGNHDCSILKGDVRQEELDAVREAKDAWTSLEEELLKQRRA